MSWSDAWSDDEDGGDGLYVWRHPNGESDLLDAPEWPGDDEAPAGTNVVIKDTVVELEATNDG